MAFHCNATVPPNTGDQFVIPGAVKIDVAAEIERLELAGHYTKALALARQTGADLFTIARLEESVLRLGHSRLLFDENGNPRATLLRVLELAGMDPALGVSLDLINAWVQQNLLRIAHSERWEAQTTKFEEIEAVLKPLLAELGFLSSVSPSFDRYEGALILGATLPRVRSRLHNLVEAWNRGARFQDLYFLGGERLLNAELESVHDLLSDQNNPIKIKPDWIPHPKLPCTECEMMQMVWEQSQIPQDMRDQVRVFFTNAPMKSDLQSGKMSRPTFADTMECWLSLSPLAGSYLIVSNAPYILRPDFIVRAIAPSEFKFDVIGSGAREHESMAIILDELARTIFQAKQSMDKGKWR